MQEKVTGKKVVFITPHDLFDPCGNGGVRVTERNYRLIRKIFKEEDIEIGVFCNKKYVSRTKDILLFEQPCNRVKMLISALLGCRKYLPWKEKKIVEALRAENCDLLFIDNSTLGKLAGKKVAEKIIVFFHNVEVDYSGDKVKKGGIQFLPAYFATKINERCAIEKADKIGCLNERDAVRIEKLYRRRPDFCLPVTFEDKFDIRRVRCRYKKEILFLGSLFTPNELGIEWFVKYVMTKLPEVRLNVVGKGFESKRKEYEKYSNVKVIGTVESPADYYYQHAVVVMPIQYGSGMKVKTAEAMMYGRIILASDEALEGYDVDGVKGIYRCNTADEYVARINEVFEKGEPEPYQAEVRKLFLAKYDTKQIENEFEKLIASL